MILKYIELDRDDIESVEEAAGLTAKDLCGDFYQKVKPGSTGTAVDFDNRVLPFVVESLSFDGIIKLIVGNQSVEVNAWGRSIFPVMV